jgi:hypothetical protein
MFGSKLRLVIYNCVTSQHWIVEKFPFKIGSGQGCEVQVSSAGTGPVQCVVEKKGSTYTNTVHPIKRISFIVPTKR